MKYIISFLIVLISFNVLFAEEPVFRNPGISAEESFDISDYIDSKTGYITARVAISLRERDNTNYYYITVTEGEIFFNEIELRFSDLTPVFEKRTDLRTKEIVENYYCDGDNVCFYNKENRVDKKFKYDDKNIYSRYAYFISFRGFPFESKKSVRFKSYIAEYGDALYMKVTNVGRETVTVKAGKFECYKLELCVSGWQSIFAGDKYYLYYNVEKPHQFIKYEENYKGNWNANELIKIYK